jgi:hypothetical protein
MSEGAPDPGVFLGGKSMHFMQEKLSQDEKGVCQFKVRFLVVGRLSG